MLRLQRKMRAVGTDWASVGRGSSELTATATAVCPNRRRFDNILESCSVPVSSAFVVSEQFLAASAPCSSVSGLRCCSSCLRAGGPRSKVSATADSSLPLAPLCPRIKTGADLGAQWLCRRGAVGHPQGVSAKQDCVV